MVGLIVAGGFFILKLDDYFNELKFYKSVVEKSKDHYRTSEYHVSPENPAEVGEVAQVPKIKKKQPSANVHAVLKMDVRIDSTVTVVENIDSLLKDTLSSPLASDLLPISDDEDIVVRKDELLSATTVSIVNINKDSVVFVNQADSLLQEVSGIRDDKNTDKQFFEVELWKSPLNYKGYRLSKNKLLVYGVTSVDDIKIYKLDDVLYFKNASFVFKLEQSNDFSPYSITTNQSIIDQLK